MTEAHNEAVAYDGDRDVDQQIGKTLKTLVCSGFGSHDSVLASAEEAVRYAVPGQAKSDPEVEPWLQLVQEALEAHEEVQDTWKDPTVNDRITRAFEALSGFGVVALENAGYTQSDGWSDVHDAQRDSMWGGVFYNGQDVERGVEGQGLWLSFGAFAEGQKHAQESARLASIVCEALEDHGIAVEWDGDVDTRIHIPPFEWRRRRTA